MTRPGYFRAFSLRGIPVQLHWTLPLGMLFFGGFAFVPAFWLAFFVLMLVHELGHAVLAMRYGHRVTAIDITGFGGVCRWDGPTTDYERGAIAWGGVMAQAVLVAASHLVFVMTAPLESAVGVQLYRAFITVNIALIAINLIPIAPLDGAEAWPFVGRVWRRWRTQSRRRVHIDADDELHGFELGEMALQTEEAPPVIEPPREHRPRIVSAVVPSAHARQTADVAAEPDATRDARTCNTNEELVELLEAIASEAAEQHRASTRQP